MAKKIRFFCDFQERNDGGTFTCFAPQKQNGSLVRCPYKTQRDYEKAEKPCPYIKPIKVEQKW